VINLVRSGAEYLQSLKGNRDIYVNGERVSDVVSHPAFKGITQTIAGLYDLAADERNNMTYTTEDGTVANKIYMIPKSREDLRDRREAISKWSQATFGMVGRSPDHVASFIAGFASAPEIFERGGKRYADNITRFYKHVRDTDAYVSYVIIPPQIDRSKAAHELEEKFLAAGVYEEREDGIVIRGSQMLGTGATVSNYLFVSCITPLRPGDETYANSFVVPVDAPGLKFYTRPSYAQGKSSTFDYPLSSRFDESDALVVFDDVFIPWDNVFVYKNIDVLRAQFHETPAHKLGNNQAQTRFVNKLKFVLGLAKKITATNGIDKLPPVQEKLAELASLASSMEGQLLASEYMCTIDKNGTAVPEGRFLYGAMGVQSTLYPQVIHIFRELVGGGVLQVPSSYKELVEPATKDDMRKYIRSANGIAAEEKVKLFKLAWEVIGTEFGGRHQQYEMFYAGAPFVAKGYCFRNYGFEETVALVESCLEGYDLPTGKELIGQ
jgi:4-hydroxyphenylacetate 3-monooxygenase